MPEHFGHYELEAELGRGGMGVVYRAYDTRRDRTVAIKRLPKHLSDDKTFQERFRRESRMAAKLNEPHIIPIHDFGEIEGQLYLDMRLVEGEDLSNLILRGPGLEPKRAVDIVSQVASALNAAHAAGLVHRDIKPSNVIVTGMDNADSEPFAYLVDFGIARSLLGSDGTALTATTGTVGTLAYMAPERISGESGDSRSDVYSLACVLYECITGKAPFSGEAFQMMFAHVNSEPPAASATRRGVPLGLDEVIRKGMAKDPGDRYQTASALAAAARQAIGTSTGSLPLAPPPPIGPPVPLQTSGPLPSGPVPGRSGPLPSGPLYGGPSGPTSGPRSGPQPMPGGPRTGPTSGPLPEGARQTSRFSGPVPPQAPTQFHGAGAPPQGPPSGPVSGPQGRPLNRPGGPPPRQPGPPTGQQRPPQGRPPAGPPPRGFVGGSGGPGGPARPPQRTSNSKLPVIIAVVVLVALIIAIVVVILVRNNDSSSSAAKSTGVPTPTDSTVTSPTTTSSSPSPTPSSTTPVATSTWPAAYAQFTSLIGKAPGDTSTAYKGATCQFKTATASTNGMIDEVACTNLSNSPVVYYVGRFQSAAAVNNYISSAVSKDKYTRTFWTIDQKRRGILLQSPTTVKFADVTSSICALPTYLVQFYADDTANLTVDQVKTGYWRDAIFPNATPAVCT